MSFLTTKLPALVTGRGIWIFIVAIAIVCGFIWGLWGFFGFVAVVVALLCLFRWKFGYWIDSY